MRNIPEAYRLQLDEKDHEESWFWHPKTKYTAKSISYVVDMGTYISGNSCEEYDEWRLESYVFGPDLIGLYILVYDR